MKAIKTVKDLRRALGWTQAKMAKALNITQGRISMYESGNSLSIWNYRKLCKIAEKHGYIYEGN